MQGASPVMPKEQALAWCEDKVDSGADLKIEQARLNGALSDAMQPKTYTVNGFTNCNSIGSYTNCNTTGYATPMPSYNSGQYGQAMGAALGAAFARPGEIKKCMAMLGFSQIEVEQGVSTNSNTTSFFTKKSSNNSSYELTKLKAKQKFEELQNGDPEPTGIPVIKVKTESYNDGSLLGSWNLNMACRGFSGIGLLKVFSRKANVVVYDFNYKNDFGLSGVGSIETVNDNLTKLSFGDFSFQEFSINPSRTEIKAFSSGNCVLEMYR